MSTEPKTQVGTFDIVCPGCQVAIALPVTAWLKAKRGTFHTYAEVDNDPMWEHSLLNHPQVHL